MFDDPSPFVPKKERSRSTPESSSPPTRDLSDLQLKYRDHGQFPLSGPEIFSTKSFKEETLDPRDDHGNLVPEVSFF